MAKVAAWVVVTTVLVVALLGVAEVIPDPVRQPPPPCLGLEDSVPECAR